MVEIKWTCTNCGKENVEALEKTTNDGLHKIDVGLTYDRCNDVEEVYFSLQCAHCKHNDYVEIEY